MHTNMGRQRQKGLEAHWSANLATWWASDSIRDVVLKYKGLNSEGSYTSAMSGLLRQECINPLRCIYHTYTVGEGSEKKNYPTRRFVFNEQFFVLPIDIVNYTYKNGFRCHLFMRTGPILIHQDDSSLAPVMRMMKCAENGDAVSFG